MVQKLKLNFAELNDYDRITEFFASDEKTKADPHGYIYSRKKEYLLDTLKTRSAAFITDVSTNDIVYFTSTYRLYDGEIDLNNNHIYTEAGSSVSLIPGYGSTSFVASLLMLKEWLYHPPERHIVSRIQQENKAAIMARSKDMGWNIVQDEEKIKELETYCRKICPDNCDGGCVKGMLWFYMQGGYAIQKEANLALRVIERGALINKDDEIKPMDYSVINEVGLSEDRLMAMAKGEFSREKILEI